MFPRPPFRALSIPLLLLALPGLSLAACGGEDAPAESSGGLSTAGGEGAPGAGGAGGELSPELVPVPAMPDVADATGPERVAPTIGDLAQASDAFEAGFYEAVEEALGRLSAGDGSGRAKLLEARLRRVEGRYDEAARAAEAAARQAPLRVEATTLRGEAIMARGRLDEAERVLMSVASEPSAHRARLMLGRLHARRGRKLEAERFFMMLIEAYNDEAIGERDAEGLAYVAMAAVGLGSPQDANDAFTESTRVDPRRFETQLEWASLFLDKYDAGHAEESLRAAFELNPEHPEGLLLLARLKIEQSFDFGAAEALLDRVEATNPHLPGLWSLHAGIALRDLDIAAADAHLDRALATDPMDLEALSVRAATRYLADDPRGFARAKAAVFQVHPTYSRMYSIIGEFGEWEHRYPDLVEMGREAMALDPRDGRAHSLYGMNLLRMGDEERGLAALNDAFRRDRFDVRVYNTLNLFEETIPRDYETVESAPFRFRFHREERALLERYVPRVLGGAYRDMRRRYGTTPTRPVHYELYATTEDFSVRTTGLPRVGVQGVCFGQVVTALSPRAGSFNWGQITWHELAHVFHIQLSNNHVPRWFTEGLAEYETIIARPEWRREMDHLLWRSLRDDSLPPLRQMNRAFTRARSGADMMVAYYASSQLVKYIVERFDFDAAVQMLRRWGRGQTTEEVIEGALGISIDRLDADFRAHSRQRLAARDREFSVDFERYRDLDAVRAAAEASPDDVAKQAELAAALLAHGQAEEAKEAAERVLARDANQPLARFVLARIAMMAQNPAAAEAELRAMVASGHDGYAIRIHLARLALARQDVAAARAELTAASRIDADRSDAWQGLLGIARQTEDAALLLSALRRLALIDEHGRGPNAELLTLLAERGEWAEVARFGEMALLLDPERAESHRLLAEAYRHTGEPEKAVFEYESALLASPEAPGPIHLGMAEAYMALRRRPDARRAVDAAVAADPSLAERGRQILGGG